MISELVYADDTLVLAGEDKNAELHMKAIAHAGANYGLLLSWGKVEVMPVRCEAAIRKPDGSIVAAKTSLVYLGSVIRASGDMAAEIGRRLGAARADFVSLERVWRHSSLSAQRKNRIFDACIASKLLCCLHTGQLSTQALRRVDASSLSAADLGHPAFIHQSRA